MTPVGLRAATVCLLLAGSPLGAQSSDGVARLPSADQPRDPPMGVPVIDQPADTGRASAGEGRNLFRSGDLVWAGVFAGGLALVVPADGLEERIARSGDTDGEGLDAAVADVGGVVGNGYLNYTLAVGTYLGGKAAGSPVAARIGLRTIESLAVANAVTSLFKVTMGRARPKVTEDSRTFRFFEIEDDYRSFPSGHASQIFAIAGTLSRELGEGTPWVPWVAYPTAAFVAGSRVVGREHWVTDVISGTAVGVLASRLIGRLHDPGTRLSGVVRPSVTPGKRGGIAIALTVRMR